MVVFFWGVSRVMDESLEKALLDMEARDRRLRNTLTASGELNGLYHTKLAELHRANAGRLQQMIAVFGWPGLALVGEQGAKAAWRIATHSIGDPRFMRKCRDLLDAASLAGDVPRWQFAIIDDRIRVYEGRPQRFGTQLRMGAAGLEPHPLEDDAQVHARRMQAGLPPLDQVLAQARAQPQPPGDNPGEREAAELEFRRSVGWIP